MAAAVVSSLSCPLLARRVFSVSSFSPHSPFLTPKKQPVNRASTLRAVHLRLPSKVEIEALKIGINRNSPARVEASRRLRVSAVNTDGVVGIVVKAAQTAVDAAAGLVPESVPRPAAKIGVSVAGVAVIWWIVKGILSTIVSLVFLGGLGFAAYVALTSSSSSSSSTEGPASGKGADEGDSLSEARRIMDKWK